MRHDRARYLGTYRRRFLKKYTAQRNLKYTS